MHNRSIPEGAEAGEPRAVARAIAEEGEALIGARRFEDALAHFDRALALDPADLEVHARRGDALRDLGRLEEAVAGYDRALALRPRLPAVLVNRGVALAGLGRSEQALASYDRALAIKPDFAEAHNNRGNALNALERPKDALAAFDRALALEPDFLQALNNRGSVLAALERHGEALASYDRALALEPDFVEAHNNRANALRALKRYDEALAAIERALALKPDFPEARINRGMALQYLDRFEEAIAAYDQAIAMNPGAFEAFNAKGGALHALRRNREAIACYARATAIKPDCASAHWNEALSHLRLGDFATGLRKYEWRWRFGNLRMQQRNCPQPRWLGQGSLFGKTILVYAEQGLGDAIQFARYLPNFAVMGAGAVFEVLPPLEGLFPGDAEFGRIIVRGETPPPFDCHCPLLSLPLAFGTTLGSIPAKVPYLAAPRDRLARWRRRLGPAPRRRIGLVWSGNPDHDNDRNRSIALARFRPLLSVAGLEFVSLVKDLKRGDAQTLRALGEVVPLGREFRDFADTAAAVSLLDLVISVDTAVAHLAGALAKPVWILLPYSADWRWLLDRDDSPWYPTARLFRQAAIGDWDGVLERVRHELARFANAK